MQILLSQNRPRAWTSQGGQGRAHDETWRASPNTGTHASTSCVHNMLCPESALVLVLPSLLQVTPHLCSISGVLWALPHPLFWYQECLDLSKSLSIPKFRMLLQSLLCWDVFWVFPSWAAENLESAACFEGTTFICFIIHSFKTYFPMISKHIKNMQSNYLINSYLLGIVYKIKFLCIKIFLGIFDNFIRKKGNEITI